MLFLVAVAFLFGIVWGRFDASLSLAIPAWSLALAATCTAVILYVGRDMRARGWALLLAACAFLAGLTVPPPSEAPTIAPGLMRVDGQVVREHAGGITLQVERASYLDEREAPPSFHLYLNDIHKPSGTRLRLLAQVRPRARFRNPSAHTPWPVAAPDAFGTLVGEARTLAAPFWATLLYRGRHGLRQRLNATLSPQSATMARALLLGEGGALSPADRDAFRQAGLAHLLAVSGLHVGLVLALVWWCLRRFFLERSLDPARDAALYTMPVAVGFALLAGGGPSVCRATLCALLILLCRFLRRCPNPLSVLGAAVLAFAIFWPEEAARPAFFLSVVATAAILTGPRYTHPLRAALSISLRTTLATAPLVLWCFEGLPLLGVIANVVVVPLAVTAMVPLAFGHAVLSALDIHWVAPFFEASVTATTALATAFDSQWVVPPPTPLQGLALVALSLGGLVASGWRARLCIVLSAFAALACAEVAQQRHGAPKEMLRITFADVGQGDGALIDLPDGRLLLVDVAGGFPNAGAEAMLPLLRSRRRHHIDLAILTHPHPDHFGGLEPLLDHITVGEVWVNGQALMETPHGQAAALVRRLRRAGTNVRLPSSFCEHPTDLGEVDLAVLRPCPSFDAGFDANDNSIVVRLTYRDRSVLFTGDIEQGAEGELALASAETPLAAELLEVPHHGSRTSSTDGLLERVRPLAAVASCGRQNRFGHPHAEVVATYRRRRIPLLRTDEDGAIIAETNGGPWTLRTESGRRLRLQPRLRKRAP